MNLKKAIQNADNVRPNTFSDEVKSAWVYELEGEIAEAMDVTMPPNAYPNDEELLMPYPHDNIYELYLMARIDLANADTVLYANDMYVANSAVQEAKAWYHRHKIPADQHRIRSGL